MGAPGAVPSVVMRTHLRIGRLLGVPIGLNIGVVAVSVLLLYTLAKVTLPAGAPGHVSSSYWFAGVLGVIGFMGSLVAHELGHSYVAARNGVNVSEITLWLFGGVAKLEREADDPGAEFRIALAGPAMSFVAAAFFYLVMVLTRPYELDQVFELLLIWLFAMNMILGISNLVPAFPLDGGRILRAWLWRRYGRRITATRIATLWGQILSGVIAAVALLVMWRSALLSGIWILILAVFLFTASRLEWMASRPDPTMLEWEVGPLGRRLPDPLAPTSTIADVERVFTSFPGSPIVPVMDQYGQVSSVVGFEVVRRVPPAQRGVVPLTSYLEPLWSLPRVHPAETIADVRSRLGSGSYWLALVTDGTSSGAVLCSEDVDEVVDRASA